MPIRLLRTDTESGFFLDKFELRTAPRYAILSHQWGPNEVLYEDLKSKDPKDGDRFSKLMGFCKKAREDGFSYIWIDTCCINRNSSEELSEAVNSTFRWYASAAICYVHLQDVVSIEDPHSAGSAFRASSWFTRGWTLQELLAPSKLVFYTQTWEVIGDREELARTIEGITKISSDVLCEFTALEEISVAEKMSWASKRKTTNVEDRAYSLMGIFGVHMSVSYGEKQGAFQRLQCKILDRTGDYSIFAWDVYSTRRDGEICGFLADSPDAFANSAGIVCMPFREFTSQWGYDNGRMSDLRRDSTGIHFKVPVLEALSSTSHTRRGARVMAIPCKKRAASSPNDYFTVGVSLEMDSLGYYNRLANMPLLNADHIKDSDTKWSVQTIDIWEENKRMRDIAARSRRIPKTYQIVVKAHTLKTLRDNFNLVPVEGPEFLRVFYIKSTPDPQIEHDQYACEWVKDSRTKDNDFVVTVRSRPQTKEDDTDGYPFDNLRYHWKWADKDVTLDVWMDSTGLASLGCQFSDFRNNRVPLLQYIVPQADNHWPLHGDNGMTVDVHLALADVTLQNVCFDLDLNIRESQVCASSITCPPTVAVFGKRQQGSQGNDSIFKEIHAVEERRQVPVQWVNTCLGIIPRDAYTFSNNLGVEHHIVRARHEGTIKLGMLPAASLWALIPSFDSWFVHRAYEYEVLVGTSSLEWISVMGPFTPETLGGAIPVNGDNGLYIARSSHIGYVPVNGDNGPHAAGSSRIGYGYGMVRARSFARVIHHNAAFEATIYEVLVYGRQ